MRGVSVVMLLATACYQPAPPAGAPCSTSESCPEPLRCIAGRCVDGELTIDAAEQQRIDSSIVPPTDAGSDASNACAAPDMSPYSVPTVMTSLSTTTGDGTPSMTADRLELYFKSYRDGTGDVFVSKRSTPNASWGAPVLVTGVSTAIASEVGVEIAADGLTLWFSSDQAGGMGGLDIYMSTRPTRQSAWSTPVPVPELNSTANDEGIFVSANGLVAYFHSTRRGLAYQELFRATRTAITAPWSPPVLVTELADASGENPWLTADDCTIIYQSGRGGGLGSDDIWIATRPARDQPFGAPALISSLSSADYDADPLFSSDLDYAVVVSLRSGGPGSYDLFEASR